VGGDQEAGRHLVEFVRRGLFARPKLTRTLAGDVAENAPERSQAFPSRLERDVGDGQIGVTQQRLGPLDPPREQVAMRRQAEGMLEGAREVSLGDAAHARQPLDRPLLVRGDVHAVFRAQQPT
jgi:hypothetical protein